MQKLKARILVVDDDPDILTAARVVLMRRFEVVDTEQNPSRLETLIKRGNYDTVVLDMNFAAGKDTGNEGLFWLKRILALDSALRVILITAYGDIQLAVAAMKLGASDFIVKPWDNESLVQAVQTSVSKQDSK
jgi:DNA-binding NtrC family response regulator